MGPGELRRGSVTTGVTLCCVDFPLESPVTFVPLPESLESPWVWCHQLAVFLVSWVPSFLLPHSLILPLCLSLSLLATFLTILIRNVGHAHTWRRDLASAVLHSTCWPVSLSSMTSFHLHYFLFPVLGRSRHLHFQLLTLTTRRKKSLL